MVIRPNAVGDKALTKAPVLDGLRIKNIDAVTVAIYSVRGERVKSSVIKANNSAINVSGSSGGT